MMLAKSVDISGAVHHKLLRSRIFWKTAMSSNCPMKYAVPLAIPMRSLGEIRADILALERETGGC